MDESPTGCWTNHHSIIKRQDQWYLFYHHNDYSPAFDKARSVRADSLFFNEDKTIRKVNSTLRGIGLTAASRKIEIDRYTAISPSGAAIAAFDTSNRFAGWKTILSTAGAWIQYNSVLFDNQRTVLLNYKTSDEQAIIEIRTGQADGPLIGLLKPGRSESWKTITVKLLKSVKGKQHLFIRLRSNEPVEINWIQFN